MKEKSIRYVCEVGYVQIVRSELRGEPARV